ncbi:MAG TPA: ribulose-phosphate 3-epimerase [bacterium]|nr:ribulose-phosphate 3-epimerase [bacterium]
MCKISPSILNSDWGDFRGSIQMLEQQGCDLIHLDVMDGHFVPNLTLGPDLLKHLSKGTTARFEVHLMVSEPEKWVEPYFTDRTETILIHPEGVPHVHRILERIRELGAKPGIVLNPGTPLNALDWVGDCIEQVLLMTVNPGFGGQKFIRGMLPKIAQTRDWLVRKGIDATCPIEVDGGMNLETVPEALNAGARIFVVGAAIFMADDPSKAYRDFVRLVTK